MHAPLGYTWGDASATRELTLSPQHYEAQSLHKGRYFPCNTMVKERWSCRQTFRFKMSVVSKSTQIYPNLPKSTQTNIIRKHATWQHYQASSIIPQSQRMCMNLLTLYTAFGSLGRLLGIGVRWVPNIKSQSPRPHCQNITLVQLRRSDSEVVCS